jgi:hypothetical protein
VNAALALLKLQDTKLTEVQARAADLGINTLEVRERGLGPHQHLA